MSRSQRVSRTLAVLLAAIVLLGHDLAIGDERAVSRSVKALDALCVSTQLDRRTLETQVQLFKHRKLRHDSVIKMSPHNETGYAVIVDSSPITVTWGRRKSEDEISRNCTVTIKDLTFSDATSLLQSKYSAEELDRFTYGLSQIAVYRAVLTGYSADMFFSVQSGMGLTALSFFETPSAETPSAKTPSSESR